MSLHPCSPSSLVQRQNCRLVIGFQADAPQMSSICIEKVDAALLGSLDHNKRKSDYIMHIKSQQIQLENLELCIQDLEEGVECLYRHFIKTRVSRLNILNH